MQHFGKQGQAWQHVKSVDMKTARQTRVRERTTWKMIQIYNSTENITNQQKGKPVIAYNVTCRFVLCDIELVAIVFITMKCE